MIAVDVTPLAWAPHGGVARLVRTLIEGWAAAGAQPGLCLWSPAPLPAGLPPFEVRVLPAASARAFRRRLARSGDLARFEAFLSPWQAHPRLGIPVVAWVHEVVERAAGSLEGRVRRAVQRRWLARNVRECAALLVPSDAVRADVLARAPGAAGRVHTVRPGIALSPGPAAGAPAGPRDLAVLVGAGPGRRRALKKGLDVVLRALAHPAWPGLPLVHVGRPGLALPAGVRTVAAPDDAALAALYARAAVVLVPSRSEGFGFPALEALAAGAPLVASAAGALPEVAGEAAWFVPPGDAAALARAVAEVLARPAERARRVALGRARAAARSPAAMGAEAAAVFDALLGGPRCAG